MPILLMVSCAVKAISEETLDSHQRTILADNRKQLFDGGSELDDVGYRKLLN